MCVLLGLITKESSAASQNFPADIFRLGLTQTEYVRSQNLGKSRAFLNACRKHGNSCQELLAESSISEALQRMHALVSDICNDSDGFLQARSREGYVRLHLMRKLMLTWLSVQPQSQHWGEIDMKFLCDMAPDQKHFLDVFPLKWSAHDVSCFVFGRGDWGIFVSMFACLWHDVVDRKDVDFEGLASFLPTPEFHAKVRCLKEDAGHSLSPARLVRECMCSGQGAKLVASIIVYML